MEEGLLYKIVFKGEIGFDFDQEEVKLGLQKFCGFDRARVDRLFSGGTFVLKKNIDRDKAGQLRDAFQRLGAFVEVVPMPSPETSPALESSPPAAPAGLPAGSGSFACPACGQPQPRRESCASCGVYFAKFAKVQKRKAREQLDDGSGLPLPVPPETTEINKPSLLDRLAAQTFLSRCGLLIIGLVALRGVLGPGLASLGFIILPISWLLFIMLRAMLRDQDAMGEVGEKFDFLWERIEPSDRRRQWLPLCTYGIILLDLLFYYLLAVRLEPAALATDLAFFPAEPNLWNVPLSAVASLFLHAGAGQLWGCLAFFWIVGPGVEKRLGRGRFIGLYLLSGVVAGGAEALLHPLLGQGQLHALGSSGAIAGLLALFISRREEQTVEFELPIFDLVSLFAPTSISVRIDALALTGLFFYAGLGGPIKPEVGIPSIAEYLIHVAGLAAGAFAGILAWSALGTEPASVREAGQES